MSNLIKKNTAVVVTAYAQHEELIKSCNEDDNIKSIMLRAISGKFNDLSEADKAQLISTELELARIRAGVEKKRENNEQISGFEIAEIIDLFKKRKNITHREVSHIFKSGVLGAYGEYFGINIKTVNSWINSFYEDNMRQLAINRMNKLIDDKSSKKEITREEKKEIMKKSALEIFFERKKFGFTELEMLSYPIYDILKMSGKIELTEDEKNELINEAKSILERKTYMTENVNVISLSIGFVHDDVTKIAKVLAVRDYMNNLIDNNEVLEF